MERLHTNYLKGLGLGILVIFFFSWLVRFTLYLSDAFHRLKEQSPFLLYPLILFLSILTAAIIGFTLFRFIKQKRDGKVEKYTIESTEKLLADAEITLTDPKTAIHRQHINPAELKDNTFCLAVYGYKSTGKSSLITALKNYRPVLSHKERVLNIILEEYDLSSDSENKNLPIDIIKDPNRFFVLISDRDLRGFELSYFQSVVKNTRRFVFALSKRDLFTDNAIDEIKESIFQKFNRIINPLNFATVAAAPLPKRIIKIDIDGNEIEEIKKLEPAIEQLLALLHVTAKQYGCSYLKFSQPLPK